MRNIIILTLALFATMANSGEVELPSRVIRAEEEYKEQVERERQKLLQAIDREINRFRLDEDEEKLAEKIVAEEDEDVRKALLSVASNKVKMSLALIGKKKEYEVERDMLGNVIEKNSLTAQGILYVKADELSQVYINGKKVMETTSHRQVFKEDITLKPGDILVVSYTNRGGGGGVTAGYVHSKGVGYSTNSAKWRAVKANDPASVSVDDIKSGAKVVAASVNEDDRADIKNLTKLEAETLEASTNAVGTFILATVVVEQDFQRIK